MSVCKRDETLEITIENIENTVQGKKKIKNGCSNNNAAETSTLSLRLINIILKKTLETSLSQLLYPPHRVHACLSSAAQLNCEPGEGGTLSVTVNKPIKAISIEHRYCLACSFFLLCLFCYSDTLLTFTSH